jgi:hypothetical protein
VQSWIWREIYFIGLGLRSLALYAVAGHFAPKWRWLIMTGLHAYSLSKTLEAKRIFWTTALAYRGDSLWDEAAFEIIWSGSGILSWVLSVFYASHLVPKWVHVLFNTVRTIVTGHNVYLNAGGVIAIFMVSHIPRTLNLRKPSDILHHSSLGNCSCSHARSIQRPDPIIGQKSGSVPCTVAEMAPQGLQACCESLSPVRHNSSRVPV